MPKTCGFLAGEQFYSFAHDLDALEIDLGAVRDGGAPFTLVPLCRGNAELYKSVYNESFAAVPNLATCADDSIEELLSSKSTTGELAFYRGEPAGVLELTAENGVPHIDGIALLPTFRGKGLGRALLRADAGAVSMRGASESDFKPSRRQTPRHIPSTCAKGLSKRVCMPMVSAGGRTIITKENRIEHQDDHTGLRTLGEFSRLVQRPHRTYNNHLGNGRIPGGLRRCPKRGKTSTLR